MQHALSLALVVLALCQAGCGRGNEGEKKGPTIGFALTTLNNPFFIDMKKGAEATAQRLGVNLIIQASERDIDVEKQMQIVENLIQRKVDALCVTPNGAREIVPAIVKATQAGIPVFVVDMKVDEKTLREAGGSIVSFAGSDNFEGGRLAGEFVASKLGGKGLAAILEGVPGHETGESRSKGFRAAVKDKPGIGLVSSQSGGFDRAQGYNVMQNVMQAHPDLQAVFACNDLMALGAIEAIAASGRTGSIVVVGFDAIDEAKEAIRSGTMDATVAQYPAEMGRVAVESAVIVLKGGEVPAFVPVKIELITKANVDSVVAQQ
ncbi:MAG: Periplasmic binding protein domain protein [Bacteroidetes bacterium]|jgi:ribose transport system substrate-binding protein|nr:Periplasmic binding protein domain protein [Bacteroidota bacterium]